MALSCWSRRQTERLFRERFLTSPARYFRDCQWEVAERLLRGGSDVLTASAQSGFASPSKPVGTPSLSGSPTCGASAAAPAEPRSSAR